MDALHVTFAIQIAIIIIGYLLTGIRKVEPNQTKALTNLGGEIVRAIQGPNVDFHINHNDHGDFDDRFPVFENLPNAWGSPEKRNPKTRQWKPEDVDRIWVTDGNRKPMEDTYMVSGTKNPSFKEMHAKDQTIFLGFFWDWPWPFRQTYTHNIPRSKMIAKDAPVPKGWTVVYTGISNKVIETTDKTDHVRVISEVPVWFINIETGKDETEVGQPNRFGVQNIGMDGIVMQTVLQTNLVRLIVSNQVGFFALVKNTTLGMLKQVIGNSTYSRLIKSNDETGEPGSIVAEMRSINQDFSNEGGNRGTPDQFGFEIIKTTVIEIDASAESKRAMKAIEDVFISEQNALALENEGKGKGKLYSAFRQEETNADLDNLERYQKKLTDEIVRRGPDQNVDRQSKALEQTGIKVWAPSDSSNNDGNLIKAATLNTAFASGVDLKEILFPKPEKEVVIVEKEKEEKKDEEKKETSKSDNSSNNKGGGNNRNPQNRKGGNQHKKK